MEALNIEFGPSRYQRAVPGVRPAARAAGCQRPARPWHHRLRDAMADRKHAAPQAAACRPDRAFTQRPLQPLTGSATTPGASRRLPCRPGTAGWRPAGQHRQHQADRGGRAGRPGARALPARRHAVGGRTGQSGKSYGAVAIRGRSEERVSIRSCRCVLVLPIHHASAHRTGDSLISRRLEYLRPGPDLAARHQASRTPFDEVPSPEPIAEIRASLQRQRALGE